MNCGRCACCNGLFSSLGDWALGQWRRGYRNDGTRKANSHVWCFQKTHDDQRKLKSSTQERDMSLVIVVADSAQILAVSDGRMFTCFGGEKKLFRDDLSKVLPVAPGLCIAATNQGMTTLFEAVKGFVSSYRGTERLFGDV